jgi:hypothetical protein
MQCVAAIVSANRSVVLHSGREVLWWVVFGAALAGLLLAYEEAFNSVPYSPFRRKKPWWQTRAAAAPVVITIGLIAAILLSKFAVLFFGLFLIVGAMAALFHLAMRNNRI